MSATRVAVIGAGPVGLTAANLLGTYGIDTLIVDREHDIIDYPRAIGIDDETLRTFQTIGLADEITRDAIQNVALKFIDRHGRPLAEMLPSARDFGWYKRNIFLQPRAEATLRAGLQRFPHVRLQLATELTGLSQDRDGVDLSLRGSDGDEVVHADYVIAADGGRSTIRTHCGITLEGETHPRKWVVIDCANDPIDAPYTALHCDPRRPYVCAHLPYDLRRWEFMLYPGEDDDEMLSPARIRELLSQHLADPDAVAVIRARVYTHHSRIASRFVDGRIALAGDAAHLMPPWAGQGLNTGVRDATNLAWKLAALARDQAGPDLLKTYEQERMPHARAMIDLSTALGRILGQTHSSTARARDLLLRGAAAIPGVRTWTLQMKFKPMPHYSQGFVSGPASNAALGRMIIQPMVEQAGQRHPFDDVLGPWFSVIGFECDPLAGMSEVERAAVDCLGARIVKVVESRAGGRHLEAPCASPDTIVIEDADNHLRPWFAKHRCAQVLVRPDRYVAALAPAGELGASILPLLQNSQPAMTGPVT